MAEKRSRHPGGGERRPRTTGPVKVPQAVAGIVITVAVFVALWRFAATESWLWFLLVPAATLVFYGPGGREDAR